MANGNSSRLETQDEDGTNRIFNKVNNIPLNASNPDLLVNFLEYWEFKDGKEVYHNSWVTDIVITSKQCLLRNERRTCPLESRK